MHIGHRHIIAMVFNNLVTKVRPLIHSFKCIVFIAFLVLSHSNYTKEQNNSCACYTAKAQNNNASNTNTSSDDYSSSNAQSTKAQPKSSAQATEESSEKKSQAIYIAMKKLLNHSICVLSLRKHKVHVIMILTVLMLLRPA